MQRVSLCQRGAEGQKASNRCSRLARLLKKKNKVKISLILPLILRRAVPGGAVGIFLRCCVPAVSLVCGSPSCNHPDESHLLLLHQAKVCPTSQLFCFVPSTGSDYYFFECPPFLWSFVVCEVDFFFFLTRNELILLELTHPRLVFQHLPDIR